MAWERRRYRGHKVWILLDDAGEVCLDDRGLAQLRYKPDDERTYTVRPAEVRKLGESASEPTGPAPIDAWAHADGPGSDGYAGIGILLRWHERHREVTRRVRAAAGDDVLVRTALAALGAIRRRDLPVRLRITGAERLEAILAGASSSPPAAGEALQRWVRAFPDLVFVPPSERDESVEHVRLLARSAPTS